ncbi:MAG: hypothetical protein DRJ15_15405, partial [Bacteroidetes bacterium]
MSAQTDYTITKDSVGNDHTLLRLEHQNGRYAEYMLEGNPDDISASFVDYINQDPLFENTTDDQLVATITLPAADLGFTPIEFCNVGDKLYCFGGNAVFQVDPATSNILNVIPLSNAGSFFMQTIIQYIPANRFILGDASQNRLFVADLSNNFYIINTLTNQVVATHTLAAFTEQQSTCIGYNPDDDIVYWMVNSWEDGTVIKSYNALTGVELQSKSFTYQINDIMFTNDYLFICNIESDIFALNPNSLAVELSHYNSIYYRYHGFCFIDNSKIAVKGSFVGKSFFRLFSTTDLQLISTHGSIFPKDFLLDLVYNDVHDAINAVIIYAQDELETISYIETYQQNAQGIYARVNSQPVIGRPIYKVGCVPTSDYVFFSGGNYANKISMVDFSIQQVHGTIEGCTSRHLFVNEMSGTEYVYSANPLEGTYSKHSNTTTALQNIKQTAFKTSSGCYNSQNDKLNFLNNRINYENSGVAIVDASDNSVLNMIQLGAYLTDIVYNENTNSIFVASRSEHKIFVLDGLTNSLISTIDVSDIPSKLFSAGSSVYCGGNQYIHVIDANTLNVTSHLIANDASFIQFEWNEEHGLIYGLFNTPNGFIAEISNSTGVLNRVVALGVAECSDLVYNDIENLIYVGGLLYPNVYVYDAHSLSQVNNISLSNDMSYGIDLEFDIYKNKVYANMKNAQYAGGNITAISCIDNTIVSSKVTHSPEEAISFNTINDQVYYNNMFINSEDRLEQCFSIDDCLDDVTENEVFSGNIFSRNYVLYYDFKDFEDFVDVFIPSTNMLYMPNGAFSNVSVIQCHNDFLEVEAGWNWLSFPRMERYLDGDFDSEAELSYLSIFPERYLKMHYKDQSAATNYKQFDPNGVPQWIGELDNLNSTKGYKLRIGGSDDPMYTHLKGGKLEPETFMDLYASEPENWVGYFVEYPQLPQDCFSPATWDALTSVVTRYWSIYKVEPSGGGTYWL